MIIDDVEINSKRLSAMLIRIIGIENENISSIRPKTNSEMVAEIKKIIDEECSKTCY